jgi:dTDP-4-dehydrorhamnose reductase
MKVVILGVAGMLGNTVARYFISRGHEVIATRHRRIPDLNCGELRVFDAACAGDWDLLLDECKDVDAVINCVGITKPFSDNVLKCVKINSAFPHHLAYVFKNKLVLHITTDCVYDGHKGNYTEKDLHTASDVYGKTKSLGDLADCRVIRTSIIGPEVFDNVHYLSWAFSSKGKKVNGYVNHFWNGITTLECAKVFEKAIQNKNLFQTGITHVFSPDYVSKYDLTELVNHIFNLDMEIDRFTANEAIDRRLSSVNNTCSNLAVKPIDAQLEELKVWMKKQNHPAIKHFELNI